MSLRIAAERGVGSAVPTSLAMALSSSAIPSNGGAYTRRSKGRDVARAPTLGLVARLSERPRPDCARKRAAISGSSPTAARRCPDAAAAKRRSRSHQASRNGGRRLLCQHDMEPRCGQRARRHDDTAVGTFARTLSWFAARRSAVQGMSLAFCLASSARRTSILRSSAGVATRWGNSSRSTFWLNCISIPSGSQPEQRQSASAAPSRRVA